VEGSPLIAGNRVFVGSRDSRLYALDIRSGKELWRFDAGGPIIASPAVAAGRLVIGTTRGELYCFGAKEAISDQQEKAGSRTLNADR
jgi:outer membrane protein assembly factor BamB